MFLAHRAPFPPDRGDRIRSFHILKYLSARATVHLAAFVDEAADAAPAAEYRALASECVLIPRVKSQGQAAVEAIASRRPVSLTAFADRRMTRAVADIFARRPIAGIYAFSGQMAQYLPADAPRTVMDFVDRDSAKFGAYADAARGPMRWMMRREARLLKQFEDAVAARVDASLFVSAAEAALLPGSGALENGIDTAFYDPAMVAPVDAPAPLIVFTGQMDYRPNVDAVVWFSKAVLPLIPEAHFAIVGRAPTPAVRALLGRRVTVTGEVADVRGWLVAADVVVAPLKLARGVQNKVLEAMAMARPVVASPEAAEGIDHDGTIRVANDATEYARTIGELLADRVAARELGQAARRRAIARYGWDARLAPLDDLLTLPPPRRIVA